MISPDPIRVGIYEPTTFTLSTEICDALTVTTPPPADIIIYGNSSTELARIKPDGTVITAYPGAEEPAAKAFWSALEHIGTSLAKRVRELEERLAKYEAVEKTIL